MSITAAGPADVEFEQAGTAEHVAQLKAAGTYALSATLDGAMLPGVSGAPHRCMRKKTGAVLTNGILFPGARREASCKGLLVIGLLKVLPISLMTDLMRLRCLMRVRCSVAQIPSTTDPEERLAGWKCQGVQGLGFGRRVAEAGDGGGGGVRRRGLQGERPRAGGRDLPRAGDPAHLRPGPVRQPQVQQACNPHTHRSRRTLWRHITLVARSTTGFRHRLSMLERAML